MALAWGHIGRMPKHPKRIDHKLLEKFLDTVLTAYKKGEKSKSIAHGEISYLISTLALPPRTDDDPNAYMKAILGNGDE